MTLKNIVGLLSLQRVGMDVLSKAHSKNKAKLEVFGIHEITVLARSQMLLGKMICSKIREASNARWRNFNFVHSGLVSFFFFRITSYKYFVTWSKKTFKVGIGKENQNDISINIPFKTRQYYRLNQCTS